VGGASLVDPVQILWNLTFMQKKFLPIAIGTMLSVLFSASSAQARFLNSNELQATRGTPIAYAAPQMGVADGQNYLADVTQLGQIRWNLDKMPLKVFIENGSGTPGYRDYYPDYIRKAFNEWQDTSNGKISWQEVSSPNQADVVAAWTANAKPNGPGVEAGETKCTIGVNRITKEQSIIHANISVLTTLMGRSFSDTDTYKTCLHEVGHAIGMEGHSSTPSDIMYPVLNNSQTPYLKPRDINTMAALYTDSGNSSYLAQSPTYAQPAPGYFGQPQGYSDQTPEYFAQQPSFQPQYDGGFMPRRDYQSPQGRYEMMPYNPDDLSFQQRQALRRAVRDRMRFGVRY